MADTLTALQKAKQWFDVTRYQPAAQFDVENWIRQIAKRGIIRKAVESKDQITLDLLVPQLMVAPLSDFPFQYNNTSPVISDLSYATGAVIPLGLSDLYRLIALNFMTLSAGEEALDEETPGDWASSEEAVDEWTRGHDDLAPLRHFGHLRVDMNARDEDIRSSFDHWLNAYRSATGVPSSDTPYRKKIENEIADWHLSKVLPYFDLTTWAAWSDNRLTQGDIVELLFPADRSADRDKLVPIKKKAKQVLTIAHAMMLSVRST